MEIKYHRFNATDWWAVSTVDNPEVAPKMYICHWKFVNQALFQDKLPLNDEFNACTDPNRKHYHYNPDN